MAERQALTFPDGFLWGAATSSHQCEGGNTNNQWYTWERAGHIKTGESCGRACDWWANAERDFDAAQNIGLNALRLSINGAASSHRRSMGRPRVDALPSDARWIARARDRANGHAAPLHAPHLVRGTRRLPRARRGPALHALHGEGRRRIRRPLRLLVYRQRAERLRHSWLPDRRLPAGARWRSAWSGARAGEHGAGACRAYREIHRLQPNARVGWAQHYNIFDPAHAWSPLDRMVAGVQDRGFNEAFSSAVLTWTRAVSLQPALRRLERCARNLRLRRHQLLRARPRRLRPAPPRRGLWPPFPAPGAPQGDMGPTRSTARSIRRASCVSPSVCAPSASRSTCSRTASPTPATGCAPG